jgi:D,D-heptose 1,7-bisphosphate phosphatase
MTRQALILCGGLGSRLGALTTSTPKPLLPVGGRPFLDVLLLELGRHNIREIVLLAAFEAGKVASYIEDNPVARRFGMRLRLAVEPDRAGTGGALYHARHLLRDEFFLLNGDSWLDFNLLSIAVPLVADTDAVLALARLPDVSRFGVVRLDADRVTEFRERPESTGPGIVNAGVYWLSRRIVEHLPQNGSFERDVLPRLASEGRVRGTVREGYFIDIGAAESYPLAQVEIPRRQRRPAMFLDCDGVLNHEDAHVGPIERFRWIEGAQDAVRALNDAGYYVFVVANQTGVARGFHSEDDVARLHAWMQDELSAAGAHIDDFRFGPHHPDATVERYRQLSPMREPPPGMLLDLIASWPVDVSRSHIIGCHPKDMEAGTAAGVKGHRFEGGNLAEFLRARGLV